ncbi:MAG: hypothetical protein EZS28_019640 [Streblomastix strix]|uniref:NrS-1 polymerase-like helicase domain-containing protein n=1 Tax=Streblomastix strix TaxID=222440 RepID=A0A5J4VR94_9EUKA|nr:MAG: hypothetical protein EZS28_019640 [Streblomastix strix]
MTTQMTLSNGLEFFDSSEDKTFVPKIKYMTLEKGPSRKYNRKSKTNDKAKALIDEMLNEQSLEQPIEQPIEQSIEQSNEQSIEKPVEQSNEQTVELTDLGEILDKYHEECRINEVQEKIEINKLLEVLLSDQDKQIQEIINTPISERVKNAMIDAVNYTKFECKEGVKKPQKTGKIIDLSLMDDDELCVIDFDINKKLPNEEIIKIRQNIIDNMLPPNVGLVKTAHGGLHAYCNRNGYRLPQNRNVKVITLENFEIDIFAQMTKYKIEQGKEIDQLVQNRVVAPNTSIHETKNSQLTTLKYEAINDWANMTNLASLREILEKWNVDIEVSYAEYGKQLQERMLNQQINNDGMIEPMSNELAQACIDGLKNLTIHNYPQAINMEVSLLSIFSGLYGITNESIRIEGINNIRKFNKLTANADKNYGQAASNGERKPNPWILIKILRYHNKDYYETIIQPLLKKNYEQKLKEKQILISQTLIPNKIDLSDDFTLLHIQKKAANEEYQNEEQIVLDLTRIIAYYAGESEDVYMIKEFDALCNTLVIHHKLEGTIYKQLDKVIINYKNQKKDPENDNKKQLTAKHIFKKYASKFVMKGCKFISDDPEIFSIFQGYKYKKLDTIDYECLQMYFDLIKETIAAGDERVYEYILNWKAWIIQNKGKISRAAIVLQGRQGIGKNRFTDVIAELTSRYSCSNITNIDEFTGRFNSVVENKMFAVLNEMMNYNESKKGIATVMKSIISDESIRINEKNQPRRTAENVMNVIYVTNNDMPVQLDTDDRRHLVCACKTVHQVSEEHKQDVEYFNELSQSYTQEFYENLMTFLLERDISQFNPTLIPMTEAKKQLINVSRSPIDDVIMEHYEQFKQGIPISLVNQCRPQNWQLKTYKNAMQHKCTEQRIYIIGTRTRVYVLNADQLSYYDKMMIEEDIEMSNKNYQMYKKQYEDDGFIEQVVQDVKVE